MNQQFPSSRASLPPPPHPLPNSDPTALMEGLQIVESGLKDNKLAGEERSSSSSSNTTGSSSSHSCISANDPNNSNSNSKNEKADILDMITQVASPMIASRPSCEDLFLLPKYRQMAELSQQSPGTTAWVASPQPLGPQHAIHTEKFRSVEDFDTEEELRKALSLCTVKCADTDGSNRKTNHTTHDTSIDSTATVVSVTDANQRLQRGVGDADWLLSVADEEAVPQTAETELLRLWTLKSYLALDAEKEMAFDDLCQQACREFGVPFSSISLVDLGRQFAFGSCGLSDRSGPRSSAFCAHSILNRKHSVLVVKDALQDKRFALNPLVTQSPHLRFYAGATLLSPEGYKLGTFCVEAPQPRPQGLTEEETTKLKQFASRAMELLVERRKRLEQEHQKQQQQGQAISNPQRIRSHSMTKESCAEESSSLSKCHKKTRASSPLEVDLLRRHAGITTNLGGLLYYEQDCFTAMHLFQESVQTLMCLEAVKNNPEAALDPSSLPTKERHDEMSQLVTMLSAKTNTEESRQAFCGIARKLFVAQSLHVDKTQENTEAEGYTSDIDNHDHCRRTCTVDGFPGLFARHRSKLRGMERLHLQGLAFSEPFRIAVNDQPGKGKEQKHFIIPLAQCSKATLFNMGLIHYHWGRVETAMQFFDLASSTSQQLSPLAFDPVILAAFNNMAQIHLQYGRTSDAMELLQDASTRGNAALTALYGDKNEDWKAASSSHTIGQTDARHSRRLRRKLARTFMNMGHVHYLNCEYGSAMVTCHDALRLLHPNMDDLEIGSVWHNMGILLYHQGMKEDAIQFLDKFIERGKQVVGDDHLQLAETYALQGIVIFEMGQLYECMMPLNEALRIRRLKLEPNHSSIAESLFYIGRVLQAREEYDFCLRAYLEGVSIHRAIAGDAGLSFETTQILLDVGRAFHAQNRTVEAMEVYQEVTKLTRRFFGDRHVFVARLLNILGNLHLELGRVDQALPNFKEAMQIHLEQGLPVEFSVVKDPLCRVSLKHMPVAPTA